MTGGQGLWGALGVWLPHMLKLGGNESRKDPSSCSLVSLQSLSLAEPNWKLGQEAPPCCL